MHRNAGVCSPAPGGALLDLELVVQIAACVEGACSMVRKGTMGMRIAAAKGLGGSTVTLKGRTVGQTCSKHEESVVSEAVLNP
jgi:hypothetical protein